MSIYDNMEEGLAAAYNIVQRRLNGVHTPATLSKGERKKCKSCTHFMKRKPICYCTYPDNPVPVTPMKTACQHHVKKKR